MRQARDGIGSTLHDLVLLPEVICCHGDGSDGRHVYHGHTCLVVVDGSDRRHVCTKYHR